MTEDEVRNIVRDELQRICVLLDDANCFPVLQSPNGTMLLPFMSVDGDDLAIACGRVSVGINKNTVQVGHGSSYASAVFSDTNTQLTSNMIAGIDKATGDYIFIKVDKTDTISSLYTCPGPNMSLFEYPVSLDEGVTDGDYKYYKSANRMNAGETSYKINRTN